MTAPRSVSPLHLSGLPPPVKAPLTMHLASSNSSRLLTVALLLSVVVGCGRQKEGERCALTNGDSDCVEALLCTEAETLRGGEDGVDRCCPDPDSSPSDSRCALRTSTGSNTGGGPSVGEGGAGGADGEGGPSSMGEACQYDSQCTLPLVCGPGGKCQFECNVDIDCDEGERCTVDQICVAK